MGIIDINHSNFQRKSSAAKNYFANNSIDILDNFKIYYIFWIFFILNI